MKWVTLEASQDEYDNSLGFIIAGTRYEGFMADRGGDKDISLIAHDIIEHQNGLATIGPVWDEMEAMGGIWHCRGRWGDIGNGYRSPVENVAADFVRMGREACWHADALGVLISEPECDHDASFYEIIEATKEGLSHELTSDDLETFPADNYYDQMLHRLRRGYRKAVKRFGDGFDSNSQFRAISAEIACAVKWIDFEGQQFRLGWGKGQCRIVHVEYDEYLA